MNLNHQKQISTITEKVYEGIMIGKIKYIEIHSTSVGGKTRFTKKLCISLKSRGMQPAILSMDDFYKDTKDFSKNGKGGKVLKVQTL